MWEENQGRIEEKRCILSSCHDPVTGFSYFASDYWGHGSDHQCQKVRHVDKKKSRQVSLLLQKGEGTPKSMCAYLSLRQMIYLSSSHRSGQGARSFQLAN